MARVRVVTQTYLEDFAKGATAKDVGQLVALKTLRSSTTGVVVFVGILVGVVGAACMRSVKSGECVVARIVAAHGDGEILSGVLVGAWMRHQAVRVSERCLLLQLFVDCVAGLGLLLCLTFFHN